MSEYKAAGIIFYRYYYHKKINRYFLQVYLQYECSKSKWSHFGGKKEPQDKGSFQTAKRELFEEMENSNLIKSFINTIDFKFLPNKYFLSSKMYIYFVHILNPFKCFYEANWVCVDYLPNNIRPHIVSQIEYLKQLVYCVNRQIVEHFEHNQKNESEKENNLSAKMNNLNIQ